jgi:hypothetical protein
MTREHASKWLKRTEWDSAEDLMTHETAGKWLKIAAWDSCSRGDVT